MAIKASSSITLASVTDVDAITPYYYPQIATNLTPPAKPTTNPPANSWTKVQPAFDFTKSVYICFLNEYSNGTWDYSDVSLWSEYEASKQAYNTAENAFNLADSAQTDATAALEGLTNKVDTSYIQQYMRYDPNVGLILANGIDATNTRIKTVLKSDRLSFYMDSVEVAYISNQQLYITQSVVLQQMDLGIPASDGGDGQWSWKVHKNANGQNNLNLKWIG